jgi:hypothetical protein
MSGTSVKRAAAVVAFGLLVVLGDGATRTASGSRVDQLTYLTFSQPVALPGVTLEPGTYAFELAMPYTSSNVVLVRDRARSKAFYSGFTYRSPRPANWTEKRQIVLGEHAPGQAAPILGWYPVDNPMGFEFIYRQ